jgi:hypothetical protein
MAGEQEHRGGVADFVGDELRVGAIHPRAVEAGDDFRSRASASSNSSL